MGFLRRIRDHLADARARAKRRHPPIVRFDGVWIRMHGGDEREQFAWSEVLRIGYRTRDSYGDDHFLDFQLRDGRRYWISLEWQGALALAAAVDRLPDTRLGERGCLANVVGNDSVVVWPAAEAGRSMDPEG